MKKVKVKKYYFYVDGKKYESSEKLITGSFIEAVTLINAGKRSSDKRSIFLDRNNEEPDIKIHDDTEIILGGYVEFYTIPQASWGG